MKILSLSDQVAKEAYKTAPDALKAILEENFGKPFFSEKITDRVKSFDDACQVLSIEPDLFEFVDTAPHTAAYIKLTHIIEALNEGWIPNWKDTNQRKYYPWFYMDETSSSPSGFGRIDVSGVCTVSTVGSRFVFKTEELAKYAATQFKEIYKEFYCI